MSPLETTPGETPERVLKQNVQKELRDLRQQIEKQNKDKANAETTQKTVDDRTQAINKMIADADVNVKNTPEWQEFQKNLDSQLGANLSNLRTMDIAAAQTALQALAPDMPTANPAETFVQNMDRRMREMISPTGALRPALETLQKVGISADAASRFLMNAARGLMANTLALFKLSPAIMALGGGDIVNQIRAQGRALQWRIALEKHPLNATSTVGLGATGTALTMFRPTEALQKTAGVTEGQQKEWNDLYNRWVTYMDTNRATRPIPAPSLQAVTDKTAREAYEKLLNPSATAMPAPEAPVTGLIGNLNFPAAGFVEIDNTTPVPITVLGHDVNFRKDNSTPPKYQMRIDGRDWMTIESEDGTPATSLRLTRPTTGNDASYVHVQANGDANKYINLGYLAQNLARTEFLNTKRVSIDSETHFFNS